VIAGGDLRSRLHYGDYPRTINDDWGIRLLECLSWKGLKLGNGREAFGLEI